MKNYSFIIPLWFHFSIWISTFYFLLTPLSFSNPPPPLLISPYTNNFPVIDGQFSPGEWDDSAWESATTYNDTLGAERGRVYIKHSLTNLFLLIDYYTATGGNTEDITGDLWLDLDNNGTNDGGFFTRIRFGSPTTNWDFPASFDFSNTSSPNNPTPHWIIEYEIPFSGLGIQPGDLLGAHFTFINFLGTGGEWFNASNLLDLNLPSNWADLLLLRGDSLDPLPPTNHSAYSDYLTPTSVLLTWDDPTHYQGGDTLTTLSWIRVYDSNSNMLIDSSPAGAESYTHTGLMDGTLYGYYLVAVDDQDSASSRTASVFWHAGGHPFPSPPESLTANSDSSMPNMAFLTWKDPTNQVDGTYLDDLAGIHIYHSGPDTLLKTVGTGVESTTISGLPNWTVISFYAKAYDNEVPVHESGPSNDATTSIGGVAVEISYDDSTRAFNYSPGGGPARYIGVRFSIPPTLATPFDIVRARIWLDSTSPLDEVQVCRSSPSGNPEYLNPYESKRNVSAPVPNAWAFVEYPNPAWIDTREDLWVLARWMDFTFSPSVGVDNTPPIDYRSYVSYGPPTWDLFTSGDLMVRLTLGSYGIVGTEEVEIIPSLPKAFHLYQNHPNPFTGNTMIVYDLPEPSHSSLKIYDVSGRLVRTLVEGNHKSGSYWVPWDGRNDNEAIVPSGVYFSRLESQNTMEMKKLILLK